MSDHFKAFLMVLVAGFIVFMLAYARMPLSQVDGKTQYLFWGTDSFFHAARILDTVSNPNDFYEFDHKSNTQISWSWGYDWILGNSLHFIKKLWPALNSENFLIHLPPIAGFLNVFLLYGLMHQLRLRFSLIALSLIAFSISPLTQSLHYVGRIDHHMFELSFTLAALWAGLAWFQNMQSTRRAIALGIILGLSHLIHLSLFVLQLPIIITLFICWCLKKPIVQIHYLSLGLLITLGITLIPSSYFQDLLFDYRFLSWFHLYIALSVSFTALFMQKFTANRLTLTALVILCLLLLAPIMNNLLHGYQFITGNLSGIRMIAEIQSPIGYKDALGFYGIFLYASPLSILALYLYWRDNKKSAAHIFICLGFVLGILMLLSQVRFSYFGYFALIIPYALLANTYLDGRNKLVYATITAVLVIFSTPTFATLYKKENLAGIDHYYFLHQQTMVLREHCNKQPGIVYAPPDMGHVLRFFTKCKVLSNMMLITEQDFKKQQQYYQLLHNDIQFLLQHRRDIDYIFLYRTQDLTANIPMEEKLARSPNLISDLILKPEKLPPNLQQLYHINFAENSPYGKMDSFPVAVLYKINKDRLP